MHGITHEFLADKPRFADVIAEFLDFVRGAELIIHNAPFDVGFLNNELARSTACRSRPCAWRDRHAPMASELHPGKRNNLDALCERYEVDNSRARCTARCSTPNCWPRCTWP